MHVNCSESSAFVTVRNSPVDKSRPNDEKEHQYAKHWLFCDEVTVAKYWGSFVIYSWLSSSYNANKPLERQVYGSNVVILREILLSWTLWWPSPRSLIIHLVFVARVHNSIPESEQGAKCILAVEKNAKCVIEFWWAFQRGILTFNTFLTRNVVGNFRPPCWPSFYRWAPRIDPRNFAVFMTAGHWHISFV